MKGEFLMNHKDKERTNECTADWAKRLTNKIPNYRQIDNQFTIPIPDIYNPNYIHTCIIAVHCPSKEGHNLLLVNKETYKNYPADIYLGYDPGTLEPQGFAMRDELSSTVGYNSYGIERVKLNRNINQLFDLTFLLKNTNKVKCQR